ncbi:MAG TPA: class II aldolase/adducin family protein [Acetobacteraceae bacterium]|jgi:ribulose-5-phosphate 4-epimerase/fuculose-1-phosphate aldolase|nr:class II aldolase/adducin family protein [Acetobacteraceae bacterium]
MSAVVRQLSSTDAEAQEWQLRCDMAAVFRIAARLNWNEQIGNHNSLMLPRAAHDDRPLFLINPRGYRFEELTASNLIVCDLDGNVVRGKGELRKVAFHIHAPIHLRNPGAACIIHVHPQYLTAIAMLRNPELALAHYNNLYLNDRVAIDVGGEKPVGDLSEGDRIANLLGDKTILLMASHGVTVVGPTVADAFDECSWAERTAMYQVTAMSTGQPLRQLPESGRRRFNGAWGDMVDAALHLASWRRILDREEPDYAT